jgi:hypothetical protein
MRNRTKSLFCSVLLNEFHHRTKLMPLLFSNFVFKKKTLNLKFQNFQSQGYLPYNYRLRMHPKKSSGVDSWYLDEFFEDLSAADDILI